MSEFHSEEGSTLHEQQEGHIRPPSSLQCVYVCSRGYEGTRGGVGRKWWFWGQQGAYCCGTAHHSLSSVAVTGLVIEAARLVVESARLVLEAAGLVLGKRDPFALPANALAVHCYRLSRDDAHLSADDLGSANPEAKTKHNTSAGLKGNSQVRVMICWVPAAGVCVCGWEGP